MKASFGNSATPGADTASPSAARALEETRFLSEATALLAMSLDYEVTLQRLAMLTVPFLADWCAVDVIEVPSRFRRVATAHVDREKTPLIVEVQSRYPPDPLLPHGYPKVLRTGEPDFWAEITDAQLASAAKDDEHLRMLRSLGYRSYMCIALQARGQVLGAMTFVMSGDRRFSRRDFEIAYDLVRRAAQAVDNALLFRQVERARQRATLLADVTRLLVSPQDVGAALDECARQIGTAHLGEVVSFVLVDEDGGWRGHIWAEPSMQPLFARIREVLPRLPDTSPAGGIPAVIRSGRTEVFRDLDLHEAYADKGLTEAQLSLLRQLAIRSGLTAPIATRGKTIGALAIRTRADRRYEAADVELVEDIAQRAALAVENARLHQQAVDAIQARDEFLSVASHELRTPLTALHLLVRTLTPPDGAASVELSQEKLEIAERQIVRIAKLVDQLFDLSRVTAGRLELELEEVDLAAVARDVVARMRTEAQESGCVVSVRTPVAVTGRWNRIRLEQIATNLLANALKYGRGRPVEVSVEDRAAEARLLVRDNGIGVAPEHLNRIFERFSRANPGRRYDGLGLGLYIVRQILKALGGTISVESEQGKGSLFVVELPKTPRLPARGSVV